MEEDNNVSLSFFSTESDDFEHHNEMGISSKQLSATPIQFVFPHIFKNL